MLALIPILVALIAEVAKDSPSIIMEIEKLISDLKAGNQPATLVPMAPEVAAAMAPLLAKLAGK